MSEFTMRFSQSGKADEKEEITFDVPDRVDGVGEVLSCVAEEVRKIGHHGLVFVKGNHQGMVYDISATPAQIERAARDQ